MKIFYICYMSREEILNRIKFTVHSLLPDAQVFLFGSQAKNEYHADNDYDLLIITEKANSPREQMNLESKIRKMLVSSLHQPFDVILQSKAQVERYKHSKGYIIYYALKDGVEI